MSDYIPLTSACTRLSPGPNLRPFYFSRLSPATSSEREVPQTLDLISTLNMPGWLAQLVMDKGGASAWKVTEKIISDSDISDQQNRLMMSKQDFLANLKPRMIPWEIEEANLASNLRIRGGEGQSVGRKRGRPHQGLQVKVYNTSGLDCSLLLVRWDANESPVLKGNNYKDLRLYYASGDLVEMWAFRNSDDKLCFVIEKK